MFLSMVFSIHSNMFASALHPFRLSYIFVLFFKLVTPLSSNYSSLEVPKFSHYIISQGEVSSTYSVSHVTYIMQFKWKQNIHLRPSITHISVTSQHSVYNSVTLKEIITHMDVFINLKVQLCYHSKHSSGFMSQEVGNIKHM